MSQSNKLVLKLAKVLGEISKIPKNGYNSFHKYAFATESDITEAVREKLARENIFIFSSVIEHTKEGTLTTVTVEYTFVNGESGEQMKVISLGYGDDKGDKGLPKALTSSMKYFLLKNFLISTGDDPEADISTDQRANGKQQQKPQGQQQGQAADAPKGSDNKRLTDKQKNIIEQRVKDIVSIVDEADEEGLLLSLRNYIGEFTSIDTMSSLQASRAITTLTDWKKRYKDRQRQA